MPRLKIWLTHPLAYTVLAPMMSIAGAGTTIAAPILLQPAAFGRFILLMGLFQYIADFDLGLARLVDRHFSSTDANTPQLQAIGLARLLVGGLVLVGVVIFALIDGSALLALAGLAGVAFMIADGPLAYYRATQNVFAFTIAVLAIEFGLTIPRFVGILTGGVTGCMVAMTIWYITIAVMLNARLTYAWCDFKLLKSVFVRSFPLFVFHTCWVLFLLSHRSLALLVSNPTDSGLFCFGANLVAIGIGIFGLIAQGYYPRHLSGTNKLPLYHELLYLIGILTIGVAISIVFCRFGLQYVFPHFENAKSSTAVMMISGIPLCICSWTISLIISRTEKSLIIAPITFGIVTISMFCFMRFGYARFGLVGGSFACFISSMMLLELKLYLLIRSHFLSPENSIILKLIVVLASFFVGVIWYVFFKIY